MPKPGQKTITIKEEIYKKAEDKAKEQGKSVAAFVTELILEKCKNQKEEVCSCLLYTSDAADD